MFSNMRRVTKGYSGEETPLFATMLVIVQTDTSAQSPLTEPHTSSLQLTKPPTSSTIRETIRQEFEIPHSNFPTQTPVVDEAAFIGLQSSKDMQILLRDELTLAEHLMEIRKECLLKLMARLNMDESESPTEDEKRESRVAADEDFDQQLQAGESVVKEIFETTMRKVQSFVPMGSELEVQRLKRAGQEVLEEPKLVLDSPVEEVYVESLNGGVMRVLGVQFKYLNHRLVDDEPIRDLNTIEDKVDNPSPQSTPQVLPSFELITSYLGPKAKHNLFRGGKQTPSLSALWIAEGTSKDGDEVDIGMGKSGGVPDGGVSALVWEGMICGDGEWEVDRASALSQIRAALYPNGYVGLASGGDDTCNGDSIGGCGGEGI
ncbi:hypothetical protein Tco_1548506 [Tanacetum coccineum]